MLEDNHLRDFSAAGPVETRFNKDFKALSGLRRKDNRERLGLGADRWLGHALLLQCHRNACKLILTRSVGGLLTAANGISDVEDRKSPAFDRPARS